MKEFVHKNEVTLIGTAAAAPTVSHENHEARFVKFPLRVLRLSGQADELTVMLPESLTERCRVEEGKRLCVVGQLRSYNNRSGSGRKLVLSVYARTLCCCEGEEDCNEILLAGAICKPPVGRSTPLGREICDVLLAVNRRYGRADYIPCIAWEHWQRRWASGRSVTHWPFADGSKAGSIERRHRREQKNELLMKCR